MREAAQQKAEVPNFSNGFSPDREKNGAVDDLFWLIFVIVVVVVVVVVLPPLLRIRSSSAPDVGTSEVVNGAVSDLFSFSLVFVVVVVALPPLLRFKMSSASSFCGSSNDGNGIGSFSSSWSPEDFFSKHPRPNRRRAIFASSFRFTSLLGLFAVVVVDVLSDACRRRFFFNLL